MSDNNKNLIAYCGLCCLDCFGYKGKVADLARDLRKELRESKRGVRSVVIAEIY